MDTNHNRIKVADLETNQPNKTLATNENGELEFIDISENLSDPVSATTLGIVDNTSLQELGGVDKTINGIRIGKGNSDIANNTALGYLTLTNNTTGNSNTSVGSKSMHINTTGIRNTAVGTSSMYNNITGSRNTTIGSTSLYYNTEGSSNVSVGSSALYKNTTGSFNIAMGGSGALNNNTTGTDNVAIGTSSLYHSITGSNNTALGSGTLCGVLNTTSGSNERNIAVGAFAGLALITGNYNILMGSDNLTQTNAGLNYGNRNIEIGKLNNLLRTGDNNTIIGWANSPTATLHNNIIISDGAGNIGMRKTDTNQLLAPTLTNALIDSGGAKSIITKEYLATSLPSLTTANAAPTSSTASGVKGDIRIDADYVYICVATNTWKRSLLTAW